jgi:IS4 transposase
VVLLVEGARLNARRVTVQLRGTTRDGDSAIHILANLPDDVPAADMAQVYRGRWTIETAFQALTEHLRCEVNTQGYPRAALFAFTLAVVA